MMKKHSCQFSGQIIWLTIGFITFCYLPVAANSTILATGKKHTCGIKNDNHLTCWGNNKWDQATPLNDTTFIQVSTGQDYTCGIQTDNTVICWGKERGNYGQVTPPSGNFSQISVGFEHACGLLTDNTVACWGNNDYGQATPPNDTFIQVSAGKEHSCGLREDNTAVCWGRSGNPWNKSTADQTIPPNDTIFSQVSAGGWHTCGIRADDNHVVCWGIGGDGQSSPPDSPFLQISAGTYYTCGIKTDNTVACWGWNEMGQAKPPNGICLSFSEKSPKQSCFSSSPNITFSHISAGKGAERNVHTCGVLTDNTVICWGYNGDGQATPPPCLRLKSSGAQIEENLPYGILYGVHAHKKKDSQFFTLDSRVLEANPFGEVYENYDIAAIDSHPFTRKIWTVSGDKASQKGYLYQIDRDKGVRFSELGKTGFNTVVGISFHPEGTLWGWAQGEGLFKIKNDDNNEPDIKAIELVFAYTGEIQIEDLTWNTSGTTLYVVENLYEKATQESDESATKKGVRLWTYTQSGKISTVCDNELNSFGEEIEAVTTIPSDNDTLLVHFSGHENLMFGVIDIPTCQIIQKEIPTNYYAIEREPKNNYLGVRNYNNVKSLAWIACQP